MQLSVRIAPQKTKVIEAGRGSGKSTVLADEMVDVVHDMPRSTNFLQGETYQQILTRTLPSTIQSLSTLGYVKDLHYTVCKKPPASWRWPEAYEPPLDYRNAIWWYTGAAYLLLSQDVSSRGLNTASGMSDEFALLNPEKFQAEALATLRGQKARFEKCRRYLSQTYTTSIPRTQEGKFIYKYEESAKEDPSKVLFLRASSHVNKANLPATWFEEQRRIMSKYDYDIEIGNIRPRALKGGFYPLFSEQLHCYTAFNNDFLAGLIDNSNGFDASAFEGLDCRQDADLYPSAPLDIALDYGRFCCIVTAQETMGICRFLSGKSIESPKLIEDLVNEWCRYYRFQQDRTVYYWYDQTATGRDGRSPKTYAEIVMDTLIANNWQVIPMYYGSAPAHRDKYNFWGVAHRGDNPNLPAFRYNKQNCKYLIESVNNAGAKDAKDAGVEKIKTDERNDSLDQRTTTHFSDAMDMLAYFKYAHLLKGAGLWIPTRII